MRDWVELAAHYRPIEGDVLHPDECVVIRIKGAEWYVRPLQLPKGIMYTPEFGEMVSLKQTVDPLGNEPMQDRADEITEYLASGPEGLDAILAVCAYVGELLDQQYDLSAELKADLLSFRGDTPPAWYSQAVKHAHGRDPLCSVISELLPKIPEPEETPDVHPWWKFWNK